MVYFGCEGDDAMSTNGSDPDAWSLAHKLLGDESCSSGAAELSSVCERPPSSNPNEQHGSGGIHQSSGRNALVCSAGIGKTPALVGRSGTSLDSSSSCTGQSLWRSGDQPFCIGRERPLPTVLLADDCYPERGCAVKPLAQRSETTV